MEVGHMGCSDLVWKLKWETVIIQALSTDNSLRMLETGRE